MRKAEVLQALSKSPATCGGKHCVADFSLQHVKRTKPDQIPTLQPLAYPAIAAGNAMKGAAAFALPIAV